MAAKKDDSGSWIKFSRAELKMFFTSWYGMVRMMPGPASGRVDLMRLYENMLAQLPEHLAGDMREIVAEHMQPFEKFFAANGLDPHENPEETLQTLIDVALEAPPDPPPHPRPRPPHPLNPEGPSYVQ